MNTQPSLTQDPDNSDQDSPADGDKEQHSDSTTNKATPSIMTDLKDPNKYCSLCSALFNNPQMALQHYNGRKHQRNQAKKELLMELGDEIQPGKTDSYSSAKSYGAQRIWPSSRLTRIA